MNLQSANAILTMEKFMNITGLSSHINGVKSRRILQVGISECGHWHINCFFIRKHGRNNQVTVRQSSSVPQSSH